MKEATHSRGGKNISDLGTGSTDTFKSINAAKRQSRKLAKAGNVVRRIPRSDAQRAQSFDNGRQ